MWRLRAIAPIVALICGGNALALDEFLCSTSKHTVRVDRLASGEYRYRVWNKPKRTTTTPDLTLAGGKESVQGTGPCRYVEWSFTNGNVQYVVGTLGCTETVPPEGTVGELSVYIDGKFRKRWWCAE